MFLLFSYITESNFVCISTILLCESYLNCSKLFYIVFLSATNWYASAVLWSNLFFKIDYVLFLSSKFFDNDIISFSCAKIFDVCISDWTYFVFNFCDRLSFLAYTSNSLLDWNLLLLNINSLSYSKNYKLSTGWSNLDCVNLCDGEHDYVGDIYL
jgi:hypothetical protein